jgi:hypothetical protein
MTGKLSTAEDAEDAEVSFRNALAAAIIVFVTLLPAVAAAASRWMASTVASRTNRRHFGHGESPRK